MYTFDLLKEIGIVFHNPAAHTLNVRPPSVSRLKRVQTKFKELFWLFPGFARTWEVLESA